MRIETIELSGFVSAFKALRLPFGKEERSESCFYDNGSSPAMNLVRFQSTCRINHNDMDLIQNLIKNGDAHAKVVRGILVYAKITAPVYWWCEMETYRAGHERLCSESTMHIDCKGMTGVELVRAKAEMPMGKELTKIDLFSYQCLRNICRQRANHRLPEWRQFLDWVHTLPFADELIFIGL